jgi:hypothetical protein
VIGAPVLLMWFFAMEGVVQWLVGIDRIATIASAYTGVIIIDYVIRGASRSFLLPFHLTGQAQFEQNVDLIATIMTGASIAIVASTNDLKLTSIGWIQVIIGIAKAITKVGYVCLKGWLKPYHCGFLKDLACRVSVCVVNGALDPFALVPHSLTLVGNLEYDGGGQLFAASISTFSWIASRTGRMGSAGSLCRPLGRG